MKDVYQFRIDAFTPESLPMGRLAEYLTELAKLFGNPEKVHFAKLRRGSAAVETFVEAVAVPKVRQRLIGLNPIGPAPDDASLSFRRLDSMLAGVTMPSAN